MNPTQITDQDKVEIKNVKGLRIQTPVYFKANSLKEQKRIFDWVEEIKGEETALNRTYVIGKKYVTLNGEIHSEPVERTGKYLAHYIARIEAEDFDVLDKYGYGYFYLVDENEVEY